MVTAQKCVFTQLWSLLFLFFLFIIADKEAVEVMRTNNIAQGPNSGITDGKKLAVTVPAPLTVADVDADEEFTTEIGDKPEMLQF
jgi:hypothetical protein